jgi:hypothetical protein
LAGSKLVVVRVKDMFALSLHNIDDEPTFAILSPNVFAGGKKALRLYLKTMQTTITTHLPTTHNPRIGGRKR